MWGLCSRTRPGTALRVQMLYHKCCNSDTLCYVSQWYCVISDFVKCRVGFRVKVRVGRVRTVVMVENKRWGNCTSAFVPPPYQVIVGLSSIFMKFEVWERWISITWGTELRSLESNGSLTTGLGHGHLCKDAIGLLYRCQWLGLGLGLESV